MIYIKSNEHNIINNYNDKVKMILRSNRQRLARKCLTVNDLQIYNYTHTAQFNYFVQQLTV